MRRARLVGMNPDGTALVVATEDGEEIVIPADERLRAALRGDRPRLGQLEIEMESALTPREIQTRIRAGESLEDVARSAGIPIDRVERFAGPVLAEREYVASQAMAATVRRRGETSTHRALRATVSERLLARGIDADAVQWDSYRLDDGRWTVTADYRSGEASRHATFTYDIRGRFSVADNDEARWLISEQSAARGPQPGRRRPEHLAALEEEPTLDLSDELALVRATAEPERRDAEGDVDPELAPGDAEAAEPTVAVPRPIPLHPAAMPESPPADAPRRTGDDDQVTDATAVPETAPAGGWEPAIVVNYPVEPGEDDDAGAAADAEHLPGTDQPGPPDATVDLDDREAEAEEFEAESHPAAAAPAERRSRARKRASVPSWDEIMFGGPKQPS